MKLRTALAGGLAGAVALNLIHETYRQIDEDAPHIHLLGEEALVKLLKTANLPEPASEQELYQWTLAGDVISNTLYYSLIAAGKKQEFSKTWFVIWFCCRCWCCFYASKNGIK